MARSSATAQLLDEIRSRPGYAAGRQRIDAFDGVIRGIDQKREELGWTKADLARAASMRPEGVRRIFSMAAPNPTLATVVSLASVVGLRVSVEPVDAEKPRAAPAPVLVSGPPSAERRTRRRTA